MLNLDICYVQYSYILNKRLISTLEQLSIQEICLSVGLSVCLISLELFISSASHSPC